MQRFILIKIFLIFFSFLSFGNDNIKIGNIYKSKIMSILYSLEIISPDEMILREQIGDFITEKKLNYTLVDNFIVEPNGYRHEILKDTPRILYKLYGNRYIQLSLDSEKSSHAMSLLHYNLIGSKYKTNIGDSFCTIEFTSPSEYVIKINNYNSLDKENIIVKNYCIDGNIIIDSDGLKHEILDSGNIIKFKFKL